MTDWAVKDDMIPGPRPDQSVFSPLLSCPVLSSSMTPTHTHRVESGRGSDIVDSCQRVGRNEWGVTLRCCRVLSKTKKSKSKSTRESLPFPAARAACCCTFSFVGVHVVVDSLSCVLCILLPSGKRSASGSCSNSNFKKKCPQADAR